MTATAGRGIDGIAALLERGERITREDALALFAHPDLGELAFLADQARQRAVPGRRVTYVIGRNVNYTNVCWVDCGFCAFYRPPGHPEAYTLGEEQLHGKIAELVAIGGSEVLLQGGLNPDLRIDAYERMLRGIKERFDVHLHAFSPTEIAYIARRSGISMEETVERLRDAGLDSIPGAGAEILVESVRDRIAPRKESWQDWFRVMQIAHRLGITTTVTMMYGSVETIEDRVDHLLRAREAQDQTGGFLAFIAWNFQSPGPALTVPRMATGYDYLRTIAVSRLVLDNIPHHQASWVTQGPKIAQIALRYGLDDFGSVMMEENVVSAAGTTWRVAGEEIRRLILEAGFEPAVRDTYYRLRSPGDPLGPSPARAAVPGAPARP